MTNVSYKQGYKYQLAEDYVVNVSPILPDDPVNTGYICLNLLGQLTIRKGYAWDGPSGPTVDTLNFMRGSLVHDALYQLMRGGHLDHQTQRDLADRLLRHMCREDGMWWLRAWWVYKGVSLGGSSAASPKSAKEIIVAPNN